VAGIDAQNDVPTAYEPNAEDFVPTNRMISRSAKVTMRDQAWAAAVPVIVQMDSFSTATMPL
jgi:hypothetical protein